MQPSECSHILPKVKPKPHVFSASHSGRPSPPALHHSQWLLSTHTPPRPNTHTHTNPLTLSHTCIYSYNISHIIAGDCKTQHKGNISFSRKSSAMNTRM